jgi:hypothetical protein
MKKTPILSWYRMRKAASAGFNKSSSKGFWEKQMTEAVLLACDWLSNPAQWERHLRRAAASTTLSIVYGHPPLTSDQHHTVEVVNNFTERLLEAALIGSHLVHFFPWLRYLPSR